MDKPFCPLCEREYEPGINYCQFDGAQLIIRSKDDMTGKLFDGRYKILHKIGEGGMGAIYKALQESTGKTVAIKVVAPHLVENPATVQRFQREVKLQSKLEHPNIVTVIDFAKTDDGQYFFVMPFIEGRSIRQMILEDRSISLSQFHDLAGQILDGLDYAHRMGIIHRDIKGDNISVAQLGRQKVAKILDFGLAKAIQDDGGDAAPTVELTQAGRAMGTPAYMAPEQAMGQMDKIGVRSDLYSLGVLFYQMLTGHLPFQSNTPWGVLHKQINEPAPSARSVVPSIPAGVDMVIAKLMEKDPAHRFGSAAEVRDELDRVFAPAGATIVQGESSHGLTPPSLPDMHFISDANIAKGKSPLLVIGVAAVALLAIIGYFVFGGNDEDPVATETVAEQVDGATLDDFGTPETKEPEQAPTTTSSGTVVDVVQNPANRPPTIGASTATVATTPTPAVVDRATSTAPTSSPTAKPLIRAPGMNLSKEERVDLLLERAKDDMEANRLTTPAGNNALQKYKRVLQIEPGNRYAEKGIQRVANAYLGLAKQAIREDKYRDAEHYIWKAEKVIPGYPAAAKWREKVKIYEQRYKERQGK